MQLLVLVLHMVISISFICSRMQFNRSFFLFVFLLIFLCFEEKACAIASTSANIWPMPVELSIGATTLYLPTTQFNFTTFDASNEKKITHPFSHPFTHPPENLLLHRTGPIAAESGPARRPRARRAPPGQPPQGEAHRRMAAHVRTPAPSVRARWDWGGAPSAEDSKLRDVGARPRLGRPALGARGARGGQVASART